jgi:hypothetical protein
MVQLDRLQMTIWRMRFAFWIIKATDTHSEFLTLIDFSTKTGVMRTRHVTSHVHCRSWTMSVQVTYSSNQTTETAQAVRSKGEGLNSGELFFGCRQQQEIYLFSNSLTPVLCLTQHPINPLASEFFLILAHPVCKMWIIQEPKKVALWNKRHFEEKRMENEQHV